jgi:hypothetical protein
MQEVASPEFQQIRSEMDVANHPVIDPHIPWASDVTLMRSMESRGAAYLHLYAEVREDGAWDMKSIIGGAFGIDQTGTKAAPIYFHLPGTSSDTLTNANVFGNVTFGYVAAGLGFTLQELEIFAALYDVKNYGDWNGEDLAAISAGYELWGLCHTKCSIEQYSNQILTHSSTITHQCQRGQCAQ